MPIRRYKPEQIVTVLRQSEVAVASGKSPPQRPARRLGFILRCTYRWRKEFGGLKVEQAKRLKALEKKNSRLKRLVADLTLDKQILTDVVKKKL